MSTSTYLEIEDDLAQTSISSKKPKKANKYSSKKKTSVIVSLFIGITISILSITTYFGYSEIVTSAEEVGINIKTTDLIGTAFTNDEPELKRDESGKRTNVLIVGIDTRERHKGLQNTDSLIIASYNYETNNVTMISIPRDTYAKSPFEDKYIKINGIYNKFEVAKKGTGLDGLSNTITDMTGVEIQYYGMIDMKGVKDIIDLLGGIDVDVENSFTDYSYPADNDRDYQTVSFEAGPQTMDGTTAIKYSRSRHAKGPEGIDYARSKRQQKVVEAVKIKALSKETLLNPKKIIEIIGTLQGNIKMSDISTDEIQAAVNLLKYNGNEAESYSFVLSPAIGNSRIMMSDSSSNLPRLGLGNYKDLKLFVNYALEEPELYEKNPVISVYDTGVGSKLAKAKVLEMQKQYPFLNIQFMGTLYTDKEGAQVFQNDPKADFDTIVTRFAEKLVAGSTTKPDFIKNKLKGEDIVILLGTEIVVPEESALTQ